MPNTKIPIFDRDASISENWRNGDPLDFAWFSALDENRRNEFRSDGGESENKSHFIKSVMQLDTRQLLSEFKLLAFGIRTIGNSDLKPELIPHIMFAAPEVKIDWDNSIIDGLGRRYESVRLCRQPDEISQNVEFKNRSNQLQEIFEITDNISIDLSENFQNGDKKKIGRPPVVDLIREIVRDLISNSSFKSKLRKEQIDLIRDIAQEKFPNNFPKLTQPSRSKILEALKAEGIGGSR